MPNPFQRIGIIVRPNTLHAESYFIELLKFLREKNILIHIDAAYVDEFDHTPNWFSRDYIITQQDDMGKCCDAIIVLGGDGTFLSAARLVMPYRVPLIGVNLGHLGFLTQVSAQNMLAELAPMLAGQYVEHDCVALQSHVERDGVVISQHLALNDVMLSRGLAGKMIEFEVFINGEFVYSQRSDGLIVSTPTGSTAYALAAGGAIIQAGLRAFTLVPVCPQSLTNRPIVIADSSQIEILVTKADDARVHFDGQTFADIVSLDKIVMSRFPHSVRVLNPQDYQYFRTLRQKLHWGEQLI